MLEFRLLRLSPLANDVERAVLCLRMDMGDVVGEEAEGDEDDTDQEENDIGEDGGTGEAQSPGENIAVEKHYESQDTGKKDDEDTDIAGETKREEGVGDEALGCEFRQFPEAVGGDAMEALGSGEGEEGATKSEPVDESAGHTVSFGETGEFIGDRAVDQTEVGRARDNIGLGNGADQAIEKPRTPLLEARVARIVLADTDHDIGALFPCFDEARDELGRMLEIGIERDNRITFGVVYAGGRRGFLAEVPREIKNAHPNVRMRILERIERLEGRIRTAVVDKEDFEGRVRECFGENFQNPIKQDREVSRFIMNGNDERNQCHEESLIAQRSKFRVRET